MATYIELFFFSNNAVIKIDLNFLKNVIELIFTTRFVKLFIGFYTNFAKNH